MNNPLAIDTTGFIFKPKPVKFRLFCFIARIVAGGQPYGQSRVPQPLVLLVRISSYLVVSLDDHSGIAYLPN